MNGLRLSSIPLLSLAAFLFATPACAQNSEARCGSVNDPLKHYILRVDSVLKKFDAKDVLEIAKNNQVCAATAEEARTWLGRLKDSRQRIATESQKQLDEIRDRMKWAEKLKTDVAALQISLDTVYDDTQGSIKDAIKFVLDAFTAEGLVLEKLLAAAKGFLLSKAVGSEALAFGVDAGTVIIKKSGGTNVAKGLGSLTLKELVAETGASAIAERWVKPSLDHLQEIVKTVDASTARSLLQNAADFSAATMIATVFLGATDRSIQQVETYLAAIASPRAAFDGAWENTDAERRFRLGCGGGSCQWTERSKSGAVLTRTATLVDHPGGRFRLERANDAEALTFLGYQPSLRQEILARSPQPSYLVLAVTGDSLSAEWYGLLAIKDDKAKLKELKNPLLPPRTYTFKRVS